MSQANVERAIKAWGDAMPDWVRVLAQACDATSQRVAAERMRYSAPVINQVLAKTYKGSLEAIETAVRGAYLSETVICPVLGDLEKHACMDHQRQPFTNANPIAVKLYRTCRGGCLHSLIKAGTSGKEST